MTFLICLVSPVMSQAAVVWSGCQTITGVTNQPAGQNFFLTLSPGITTCTSTVGSQGITGAVTFQVGQDSLATGDLSGLFASALTAISIGKTVQITYDNATCYANAISIGGIAGACP
jgi:hypothetical protein